MSGRKPGERAGGGKARGSTSREPDDGRRGNLGVVVSLVHRPDGTVRVAFDDVRAAGEGKWDAASFFTSRDYPAAEFMGMKIGPDELNQVGLAVVARLLAMTKRFTRDA